MIIIMIVICGAAFLMLYWQFVKRRAILAVEDIMGVEADKCVPKLEQIRVLAAVGIHFVSEEEKQKFVLGCTYDSNEYLASHPYYGLLMWAGSEGLLDCVYALSDRECVYDDFYGGLAEQLKRISGLPMEDIMSLDRYSVSFTLYGRKYQWSGKKNRDWLDTGLADYMNEIIAGENRFYLDNTHEGPIYVWGPADKVKQINACTGLKFRFASTYLNKRT